MEYYSFLIWYEKRFLFFFKRRFADTLLSYSKDPVLPLPFTHKKLLGVIKRDGNGIL